MPDVRVTRATADRLAEIEDALDKTHTSIITVALEDIRWLVARVKELEGAAHLGKEERPA